MASQNICLNVLPCTSPVKFVCKWCSPDSWNHLSPCKSQRKIPLANCWPGSFIPCSSGSCLGCFSGHVPTALHVSAFLAWDGHSACSWGSLPLALHAGLCPYSWAPAWTMIPKAKQGRHSLLCSPHLGWGTDSGLCVPQLIVLWIAEMDLCWGKTRFIWRLCSAPTAPYWQFLLIPVILMTG